MPENSGMSRTDAERLVRVEESLKRVEGKLDLFVERAIEDRTTFTTRITALERWRYGTGAAVISAALLWLQPVAEIIP